MEEVEHQIKMCQRRYTYTEQDTFVPVLKDEAALKELDELHKRFVFTPVDKANKNIAVICKPFYIKTLYNELYGNTNDPVYREIDLSEEEAVKQHHNYMDSINLPYDAEQFNTLPVIYI